MEIDTSLPNDQNNASLSEALVHLVDKNGMLKKNMYDRIRLRYIWQYLVYIRNHNKELSVFKKHLGNKNSLSSI